MTILFVCTIIYYRKYSQTKKQLDYEVNDIRNLARPSAEMQDFDQKNTKYSNLSVNASTI